MSDCWQIAAIEHNSEPRAENLDRQVLAGGQSDPPSTASPWAKAQHGVVVRVREFYGPVPHAASSKLHLIDSPDHRRGLLLALSALLTQVYSKVK